MPGLDAAGGARHAAARDRDLAVRRRAALLQAVGAAPDELELGFGARGQRRPQQEPLREGHLAPEPRAQTELDAQAEIEPQSVHEQELHGASTEEAADAMGDLRD